MRSPKIVLNRCVDFNEPLTEDHMWVLFFLAALFAHHFPFMA